MKNNYEVTVGNIGNVYSGSCLEKALQTFREYKSQSKEGYGRAAGEEVVLWENGDPKYIHEKAILLIKDLL